jgi:iron complex transport system substrate-binding protein
MAPRRTPPRHRRTAVCAVVVALLALAGCGRGAPPPAAGAEAVFPAAVTHEYGRTVVDDAPERVVALGPTDQDPLLALGVVPVAVREFPAAPTSGPRPWQEDLLQGQVPQVLPADVAPDAVAALDPDLIVAISAGLTREQYEAYSAIAPTIAAPGGFPAGAVPWQDATRLTAAALGSPTRGDRLVAEVEDEFLDTEEERPELAGATVAAVRPAPADPGSFIALGSHDLSSQFLKDLGMQPPAEVDRLTGTAPSATISADQLRTLDRADAVVVVGGRAEHAAFAALPGYAQLGLVQHSKVVTLDDDQAAALTFGSVLSLPWVLDGLAGRITRAVQR